MKNGFQTKNSDLPRPKHVFYLKFLVMKKFSVKCVALSLCVDHPSWLKVVSATFLLVCFVSLKESTCETKEKYFYFTSKAFFVLGKIKF